MAQKGKTKKPLTPREQRGLDIEIGFIEGVVRRDPSYEDALKLLADDYTKLGRVGDAVPVDERLVNLQPRDPEAHYHLACSYALTEQFDRAVEELDQALTLGYSDIPWLRRDPDLAKLRKHPAWKRIRVRLRGRRVKVS